MTPPINRRQFLKAGAAGLACAALPHYAAEFADSKKRVGLIGAGWYGKVDLLRLIQVAPVEVVSLCDVDSRMLDDAADLVATRQLSKKRPRIYADYREMLKEKDLDVVLIATPDHWHALAMIEAARSGADLYVQKPISADVVEGQAMLAAARKYNRVVQVGTQRRSTPHLIEARDQIIREGRLGRIAHVKICCYYHMRARGNPPDIQPPAHLEYEMWTGPAPLRPYNDLIHPRRWWAFMEYGPRTRHRRRGSQPPPATALSRPMDSSRAGLRVSAGQDALPMNSPSLIPALALTLPLTLPPAFGLQSIGVGARISLIR
jgi:hypothetical protein